MLVFPFLQVRKQAAEKVIRYNAEWKKLTYPYDDCEILECRDRFVEESLGLKMSWRGEQR